MSCCWLSSGGRFATQTLRGRGGRSQLLLISDEEAHRGASLLGFLAVDPGISLLGWLLVDLNYFCVAAQSIPSFPSPQTPCKRGGIFGQRPSGRPARLPAFSQLANQSQAQAKVLEKPPPKKTLHAFAAAAQGLPRAPPRNPQLWGWCGEWLEFPARSEQPLHVWAGPRSGFAASRSLAGDEQAPSTPGIPSLSFPRQRGCSGKDLPISSSSSRRFNRVSFPAAWRCLIVCSSFSGASPQTPGSVWAPCAKR